MLTDTDTITPIDAPPPSADATPPDAPASVARQFALLIERIADASRRPLLISQENAPAFLGVSRAVFFRLKSAGVLRPVEVDGGARYRRRDLEQWAEKLKYARG